MYKLKEVIKDLIVLGVTPGLPLDIPPPVDAIPHVHGPVLAVGKCPDINLSLFPRGVFCSSPRFLSFSLKLKTPQKNQAHIQILHKQTFLMMPMMSWTWS